MSVYDVILIYVVYVSVLVYCPTHVRQGMPSRWPAPDPKGYSMQSRLAMKFTLVPPYKCFVVC